LNVAAALPVSEGSPEPLGVRLVAGGINVAVRSEAATCIELCLFDEAGEVEVRRITLPGRTGPVFHAYIEGVGESARYGLRAHGPYAPAEGHRFNADKLLVDPYALALDRPFALHPSMFGYAPDGGPTEADSGPYVPKGVVIAEPEAASPTIQIPWTETVIYELHVKGFTRSHPDIPEALRGTFAALAHPAAIGHLKRLGVTTVEVMPAAAWIDERHLGPLGLTNYWGYNPIAFMAPDPRLAPGGWAEIRATVGALADAGIETILDVVLNHTGEGDALGPTLSLRGLDNAGYYRLNPGDPAGYVDDSGTGDTLALDRPAGVRLAMDTLRAWRRYGGVAGFRFDLAPILGRRPTGFDVAAPLLAAMDQDPELRGLKRIAEPWDIGLGGYRLGKFPPDWGEWNDRFRDTVRRFWRGDRISLGELATRLAGSEDLFENRRPSRSVNFVAAHDGFTLADIVSYGEKHNLFNGENNRDGTNDNHSWNNGVEGPSDDPAVLAARANDQRALLACLLLARGTPMLSMGAELGHSQGGNNNAYAQDNAQSWLDWTRADHELTAFAERLIAIRRRHPALCSDCFLTGAPATGEVYPDIAWRKADGSTLDAADWDAPDGETLVMVLAAPTEGGLDRVLIAVHRGEGSATAALPTPRDDFVWTVLADTADPDRTHEIDRTEAPLAARSVVVLAETPDPQARRQPSDAETLNRLARAAGIAPSWSDIQGTYHRASPDTERALLAAMGLPADTAQGALESLHRLAESLDRRPLPHVLVRRIGEPIALSLPQDRNRPPIRTWLSIEGEDGHVTQVRATADEGAPLAQYHRDGRDGRAVAITLPPLAVGRYRIRREDHPDVVCRLTIAPAACFAPDLIDRGERRFGVTAQLYSLRRDGDQGIGDFTTLGQLGEDAARRGAAVLGVNPLHALFGQNRELASPYYPSDRRFLDPIYLDLDQVTGAPRLAERLASLSAIDYPAVWARKAAALEAAFAAGVTDSDFDAFVASGGEALLRFATFEAISEAHGDLSWSDWPDGLRDAASSDVAAFTRAHAGRMRFHQYLQWLCERQLAAAAKRASGLELGVCRDLAVGAAPGGAEIWAQAGLFAHGVVIGAPPDPLGPQGQVWGLPPFDPHKLAANGYDALTTLYAANMRHAGVLRIDHVMAMTRLFWIPDGASAADGAYVDYPLNDVLGELALESTRARCLVIGEDLGTVPEGLRDTLAEAKLLSYRVLPFEREPDKSFIPPSAYPRLAWACVATHDLPPLAGWWDGVDIDERLTLELITPSEAETARGERTADRRALVEALALAGLADPAFDAAGALTPALAGAIHAYAAKTPSVLAIAQVEDLAGEREAVNLPGTDRERPNWRRRVAEPIETLFGTPAARAIMDALRAERPEPT
jgi:glycogen debranching enzyme GlgX/4-alpha-glucanotransferase